MGLGKRFLGAFVEEVPEEVSGEMDYDAPEYSTPEVEVKLDEVKTESLISDIYAQNGVMGENGIFKVEEIMNTLPSEMATDVKRKTVQGILSSFDVTVTDVVEDGERRKELLSASLEKIVSESSEKVGNLEAEIEEMKVKISELEKEISNEKMTMKTSNDVITSEHERVCSLVKFIGGE